MLEFVKPYIQAVQHTDTISGFPIVDFIEMENARMPPAGGGTGLAALDGLVIPLGLDAHVLAEEHNPRIGYQNGGSTQQLANEMISDDLFDKLFSQIGKIQHKTNKTKTMKKTRQA
jgi:hypothetical protein